MKHLSSQSKCNKYRVRKKGLWLFSNRLNKYITLFMGLKALSTKQFVHLQSGRMGFNELRVRIYFHVEFHLKFCDTPPPPPLKDSFLLLLFQPLCLSIALFLFSNVDLLSESLSNPPPTPGCLRSRRHFRHWHFGKLLPPPTHHTDKDTESPKTCATVARDLCHDRISMQTLPPRINVKCKLGRTKPRHNPCM